VLGRPQQRATARFDDPLLRAFGVNAVVRFGIVGVAVPRSREAEKRLITIATTTPATGEVVWVGAGNEDFGAGATRRE
jgi:hypothetical protein